jgi:hypothetical protein
VHWWLGWLEYTEAKYLICVGGLKGEAILVGRVYPGSGQSCSLGYGSPRQERAPSTKHTHIYESDGYDCASPEDARVPVRLSVSTLIVCNLTNQG